ncbi:MAG: alpha-L-rhamnosidase N-terminal domain-containing protein [Atopobiaceae bacterium]|jgi:alpha-L-rhamnosidase|nr:alpha-L-rhamnosidase N-terminal domain-containing protein [Atopobiaceae bacterium]
MTCALAAADWISGDSFEYGPDGAGYYADHHNQVVSGSFVLAGTEGARLDIAALGCYSVRVNGRRLDGVELSGDWTNYSKAVYYDSFDISGMVRPGENEISIELGNGMYNPAPLTMFGKYNLRERLSEVGTPKVACVVTQGGETALASGPSWTWTEGQLLFNNLYLGERRDMAFVDRNPKPVRSVPNGRRLERGVVPKCVRAHAIAPVGSVACGGGTLFDFGEMVAGFIHLSFRAAAGALVEASYAETLDDDGAPSYESNAAGLVGVMTPRGRVPGGPGAPELAVERDLIALPRRARTTS